jgi:ribosomal protein S18 acetylase RimI-like enzyme
MIVDKPSLSDAREIAEVHVASWRVAFSGIMPEDVLVNLSIDQRELDWKERLLRPGRTTFVARIDKSIVGWIGVGRYRGESSETNCGEVYGIYVSPDYFGRGVGSKLWKFGISHLVNQSFRKLAVWVLRDNHRARLFYDSKGFRLDGSERLYKAYGMSLEEVRYSMEIKELAN